MAVDLVYMLDRLKLEVPNGRARSVDGGRFPICAVLEAYATGPSRVRARSRSIIPIWTFSMGARQRLLSRLLPSGPR